jgi:hypothetical protein
VSALAAVVAAVEYPRRRARVALASVVQAVAAAVARGPPRLALAA